MPLKPGTRFLAQFPNQQQTCHSCPSPSTPGFHPRGTGSRRVPRTDLRVYPTSPNQVVPTTKPLLPTPQPGVPQHPHSPCTPAGPSRPAPPDLRRVPVHEQGSSHQTCPPCPSLCREQPEPCSGCHGEDNERCPEVALGRAEPVTLERGTWDISRTRYPGRINQPCPPTKPREIDTKHHSFWWEVGKKTSRLL